MATKFEDFIQKVVRKLRGEDQEAELVLDYVSLSTVLKIHMVKTFMLENTAVPFTHLLSFTTFLNDRQFWDYNSDTIHFTF